MWGALVVDASRRGSSSDPGQQLFASAGCTPGSVRRVRAAGTTVEEAGRVGVGPAGVSLPSRSHIFGLMGGIALMSDSPGAEKKLWESKSMGGLQHVPKC